MSNTEYSFTKIFWKKLRRNKGAVFGLSIIVMALLTAVFAYVLAPDATPDANRIIVEIAAKKPGYKQQFIKIEREQQNNSSIADVFFGAEDRYQYIPISSYKQTGNRYDIEKFVDDGVTEPLTFTFPDLQKERPIVNKTFWLGTDKFGRDILSRLIVGVRVSLGVGLIAVAIALTVGIFLGAVAGYFRGWIDEAILWLINVVWSIPTLLLVFAITLALGKGFWQVFIAVGLTLWVNVARLVRGQVLSIRELNYIEATKAMGFSHARTIFKHILPNIMGPVIVIAASNFASAIIIEAGLSFLGVGVQAPQPSWGLMIKENYNSMITNHPRLALAPELAIMFM